MFAKVFITLALVGAIAGSLNAQPVSVDQQDCPQICPLFYAPICGTDGDNFLEFSNPCELKANNCRMQRAIAKPFVATALDWCRTELVNGMDSLLVKLVKLGDLDMSKPECMQFCALIYKPVCISNGKYRALASNQCVVDTINCALGNQDTFKVLQLDTC